MQSVLDEKQVVVQLRSVLCTKTDSDPGLAAAAQHPGWPHWRRRSRGYHPYGPIGTIWMVGMRSAQKRHDS